MKIEHHISQLLYRYQCVTVPGFGAFLTEFQSAQLDKNSNSFYPPKKLISFNPFIKNNDGLLANHVAQAEKISYEIAVNAIQNEVVLWKTKIQEAGRFSVKNIGDFSLNSEKNLVFIPVDQINYLSASFGLSSFVSPNVKREVATATVEQTEEKAPILFIPEKRKNYSFIKYAAVVTLTLGLTGSWGYTIYKNHQEQIALETRLAEEHVQRKINEKIQEATFFIDNPLPAVTLTVPSEKMSYHVVAGAYRLESNAENSCKDLIKLGFKARRIAPNKHGLFPVLYGSYPTYMEAQKAMKEIQKTQNPEAWVLIEAL